MNVELPAALERHKASRLKPVPVIADYCNWEATPLGPLQAVPRGHDGEIKPLVEWSNPNIPLTTVAKLLQEMTAGYSETRMASLFPDPARWLISIISIESCRHGYTQAHRTLTVSARSAEMLDLAFASATSLIARSSDPPLWVERLQQRVWMVVRLMRTVL